MQESLDACECVVGWLQLLQMCSCLTWKVKILARKIIWGYDLKFLESTNHYDCGT